MKLIQSLAVTLLVAVPVQAQITSGISGIPGDDFPDVFYSPFDGTLTIDTDGIDMVALFVGGPDVSTIGCNLCDGMNLPATGPLDASDWTVGFSNGSTQWIRTNPLQGRGFVGTIAENFIDGSGMQQPWPDDFLPFLDYPDQGLGIAQYPMGTFFDPVFDDGTGALWEITIATDDGRVFLTSTGLPPANDPPVVQDDFYTTTPGGTIDTALDLLPGVLDNDFDPEGIPLTATPGFLDPSNGVVTINPDGSFVYAHDGSNALTDSFTYLASDGLLTEQATVFINIVPEPNLGLFALLSGLLVLGRFGQAESS